MRRIADANIDRGIEVLPNLPADEDRAAAGDDRLAQIVVELLLRIGCTRIELTNARVHGRLRKTNGNAPRIRAPAGSWSDRPK